MNTKELRIGNVVNPQFPMRVVSIPGDYVYCDFDGNEGDVWEFKDAEIMGVPITQAVLEKYGFEKGAPTTDIQKQSPERFKKRAFHILFRAGKLEEVRIGAVYIKGCKYLHQIQNAFFSVYGNELTNIT